MIKVRGAAMLGAVVLTAAGCVSPSRADSDYRHKAANTAKAMASVVATAHLVAQAGARGRGWASYVEQTLNDAIDDATGIQGSFDAVQSPSETSDALGQQVDAVLTAAINAVDQLLTDARRGHLDDLSKDAEPLQGIADKLDALQQVA